MKRMLSYGLLFIMISGSLLAQEVQDLKEFGLIKQQEMVQQAQKEKSFSGNSIVTIQQVGYQNYANVTVKAMQNNINVSQLGNQNTLDLYKNAREINQSLVQKGNNNTISDFSANPYSIINNQVIQYGNNLNYTSYGTNSISDDMKIIQRGNSGSVLIFNR
ncbi:hypothetical protein [Flavobacterium cerinum]|uniref:Curlin n=1 Tax=Flavobacterium cerinum TaxID=2502784 RepID=A0ABY5ISI7_9FLAO|nr:hypothetical protein [Flavobacterium cerinum]UUC45266.1 hypothetical protein NOX80_16770 [Flavobacterium cerinum]